MSALEILIRLLRQFEGCRLVAYQDVVGIWTIGYGETLNVTKGMIWTQAQAEFRLRVRATQFLLDVQKRCPRLLDATPKRQAACASLAYNIGVSAFAASSVCRKTARGDVAGAADAFLLWNKAGGRVISGLTKRREIERNVYLS